jgi:hypothetical protein
LLVSWGPKPRERAAFNASGDLALGFTWGGGAFEDVAVEGDVLAEVLGDVFFGEDGGYGTLRLAGAAIDALIRMDVELVRAFVDAVDWADVDAGAVLGVDACFGDDVRHR